MFCISGISPFKHRDISFETRSFLLFIACSRLGVRCWWVGLFSCERISTITKICQAVLCSGMFFIVIGHVAHSYGVSLAVCLGGVTSTGYSTGYIVTTGRLHVNHAPCCTMVGRSFIFDLLVALAGCGWLVFW